MPALQRTRHHLHVQGRIRRDVTRAERREAAVDVIGASSHVWPDPPLFRCEQNAAPSEAGRVMNARGALINKAAFEPKSTEPEKPEARVSQYGR